MINKSEITGLILAGGRATRMGSVDKGLQEFHDVPMVQHVADRIAPQVMSILINANRNLEQYRAFGMPVLPDQLADFAGPLAGFQAGLLHCRTEYMMAVPCDSPFLPADLVDRLAGALVAERAELAVAVTVEKGLRQAHPVFCLMKKSLLPHLNAFLENGGRGVEAWYSSLPAAEVLFTNQSAFRNINTTEQLRELNPWQQD